MFSPEKISDWFPGPGGYSQFKMTLKQIRITVMGTLSLDSIWVFWPLHHIQGQDRKCPYHSHLLSWFYFSLTMSPYWVPALFTILNPTPDLVSALGFVPHPPSTEPGKTGISRRPQDTVSFHLHYFPGEKVPYHFISLYLSV